MTPSPEQVAPWLDVLKGAGWIGIIITFFLCVVAFLYVWARWIKPLIRVTPAHCKEQATICGERFTALETKMDEGNKDIKDRLGAGDRRFVSLEAKIDENNKEIKERLNKSEEQREKMQGKIEDIRVDVGKILGRLNHQPPIES